MISRRRWLAAALGAVAVAGCGVSGNKAGGEKTAQTVVLSLAHALDDSEIRPFLNEVGRVSNGSIRIDPRGVPRTVDSDDDAAVVDTVLAGAADLGVVSIVLAPLNIDSFATEERVLRSDIARMIAAPGGLDTIGVLPGPLIRPAGVKRPLLGAGSYRNTRVAVRPSERASHILTALRADPIPHNLRGQESFTAEAIAAPTVEIASRVYDGVATTFTTNVVLGARALIVFGGTAGKGDVLTTAARAAIPASIELRRAEENAAVGVLCRRGRIDFVTASDADVASLRTLLTPDPQMIALQVNAPPADVPSCAEIADSTVSTMLDGVYEITTDRGIQRMTLARGRFADVESHGSYAVHGDVLLLSYADNPDTIAYRWTLYDEQLILYPVEGRNSPERLRMRPWRRVGAPPEAAPTVLDGVYEISTGSGAFHWTLDRGQLHQVRESGGAWANGSYVITGDVLAATYTEIGGEAPAAGPIKPGETAYYRWNLYRGQLHLGPVEGAYSPPIFCAAWRRVGDAP